MSSSTSTEGVYKNQGLLDSIKACCKKPSRPHMGVKVSGERFCPPEGHHHAYGPEIDREGTLNDVDGCIGTLDHAPTNSNYYSDSHRIIVLCGSMLALGAVLHFTKAAPVTWFNA